MRERSLSPIARRAAGGLLMALSAIMLIPQVMAYDMGPLGHPDLMTPVGIIVTGLLALGGAALVFGGWYEKHAPEPVRHFVGDSSKAFMGGGYAIVAALVISSAFAGGIIGTWFGGSPTSAVASSPATAVSTTTGYFSQTDTTFTVRDAYNNSAVLNAVINAYPNASAYTDQQIEEKQVLSKFTCTTDATGTCKITAMDAGLWDVMVSATGHYPNVVRGMDNRIAQTALSTSSVGSKTFGTIALKSLGTIDTSKNTASGLGWTPGTSNTYTIYYGNTGTSSYIDYPAVKFLTASTTGSTATNITFSSVNTGQPCYSTTVNGATWVVWNTHEIGPSGVLTCAVTLQYASGSTAGKFQLQFGDYFQTPKGVQDLETNANVNHLASSTLSVTR